MSINITKEIGVYLTVLVNMLVLLNKLIECVIINVYIIFIRIDIKDVLIIVNKIIMKYKQKENIALVYVQLISIFNNKRDNV